MGVVTGSPLPRLGPRLGAGLPGVAEVAAGRPADELLALAGAGGAGRVALGAVGGVVVGQPPVSRARARCGSGSMSGSDVPCMDAHVPEHRTGDTVLDVDPVRADRYSSAGRAGHRCRRTRAGGCRAPCAARAAPRAPARHGRRTRRTGQAGTGGSRPSRPNAPSNPDSGGAPTLLRSSSWYSSYSRDGLGDVALGEVRLDQRAAGALAAGGGAHGRPGRCRRRRRTGRRGQRGAELLEGVEPDLAEPLALDGEPGLGPVGQDVRAEQGGRGRQVRGHRCRGGRGRWPARGPAPSPRRGRRPTAGSRATVPSARVRHAACAAAASASSSRAAVRRVRRATGRRPGPRGAAGGGARRGTRRPAGRPTPVARGRRAR